MRMFEIIVEGIEDKKRIILKNQGAKITQALTREQDKSLTAEKALDAFEKMDPTKNKQNFQWIANQYINGQFRLEDAYKVTNALTLFAKFSSQLPKRDVNQYTFNDLVDAVEEYNVQGGEGTAATSEHGKARVIMKPGADGFSVIQPLDKEAACYYGKGTSWCTADERHNAFDSYKDDLYILTLGNRRFQYHYRSGQFMDEKDRQIGKNDIELLSKSPGYTKFLNWQIQKHYKKFVEA